MATQPQQAALSHASSTPPNGKSSEERGADHLEVIRTDSRVPANTHYYEKDGLRTYGDDEDHDHEPPVRTHLLAITETSSNISVDDGPPGSVPGWHGILVDWFSNTGLSFR